MRRNDPFALGPAALGRPSGHGFKSSRSKMQGLHAPLKATGIPLGGIGTGGITRASDGRFTRWTVKAGGLRQFDFPANGFLLRAKRDGAAAECVALQPEPLPQSGEKVLRAFAYETQTPQWSGLFPFAIHQHAPVNGVVAECKSFSPVIAGDLDASCLPVALFRWRLTNTQDSDCEASIAFHLANMNGLFSTFEDGKPARVEAGCFNHPALFNGGKCVLLDRKRTGPEPNEGDGQWAISVMGDGDCETSQTICFDGHGDGKALINAFAETGLAPDLGQGWVTEGGFREVSPGLPTAAVSARVPLQANESREVTFALVWDLPVVSFGQGRKWYRAYTDKWGCSGRNGAAIARYAHENADRWEREINDWHLECETRFDAEPHRAGMAINELYFLVDGMSVLTSAKGSPKSQSHFGIIECPDYALYNTLDLWIYAAEAVASFSPELSASVTSDYADQTLAEDLSPRQHRFEKTLFPLNPAGICPHDLGGPGEDPFVVPNSYTHRDPTIWKDLNCDLVLSIWRDGERMGSEWRGAFYPHVKAAIDHLQRYDRDGDGLIENDGTPDQTFDNIPMKGPSSYCGGLWIAALLAGAKIAREAGHGAQAGVWQKQAEEAKNAYVSKLFNGKWFDVDTSGPLSKACFIEQLFGPFLARRYGLGDIVEDAHARSALLAIYQNNFLDEGGGEGAVSLARISEASRSDLPHKEDNSFQTSEIQPGFNLSFAAQLEEWGLFDEADGLRKALYQELYEKRNLVFQTPAAIDRNSDTCRAIINMRPLSVWWMRQQPGDRKGS